MSDDYRLLLPFDTDSPEFTRGFEMGRVWTLLQSFDPDEEGSVTFELHAENTEMVLRIAEQLNLGAASKDLGDGWLRVTFREEAVA